MDPRLGLALVIGVYLIIRTVESWINQRNTRRLQTLRPIAVRPDGFAGIAAVQALTLCGLVLEGFLLPTRDPVLWMGTIPLLMLALAALLLRWWCMATLGERWTFRVWILPERPLVAQGPYRWLNHPNYLAVFLEYLAVPLAFGLWFTAAIAIPLGAWSLLHRKRIEEAALRPLRGPLAKTG